MIVVTLGAYGQERLQNNLIDPSELIEDYDFLLKTLEETHPNLYAYIPKDEFLIKTKALKESIDRPMLKSEFHKILLKTIALVKQGHTMVFGDGGHSDYLKAGGLCFPFKISCNNNKIYIDKSFSTDNEFIKGTELIAINRIPVNRIIEDFTPYLRVRPNGYVGETLTFNFDTFLWLIYGFSDKFTLSYILPDENLIRTKAIDGVKIEQIEEDSEIDQSKDFEFGIEPERKTALLKINTFEFDYDRYDSLLTNAFIEIKRNKIENLIIDVRANSGGNGNLVGTFVSYLTDKPYIATSESQIKTSEATKLCFTTHPIFVNAIEQARKAEGDSPNFLKLVDCFLEGKPGTITTFPKEVITPKENQHRFNGQVYVLTSKDTFSAATQFSVTIKDNNLGYIVGEETSDNPTEYGCIMLFKLPHTQIIIQNSTQYNVRPAGYDDQRGVIPDFKVEPTFYDYINNYDRVLNYTYWLIDEKIKN